MPNVDHHPCLRGAEELAAAKKSKAIYLYKIGSPPNESVLSEMAKKSLIRGAFLVDPNNTFPFLLPRPSCVTNIDDDRPLPLSQ